MKRLLSTFRNKKLLIGILVLAAVLRFVGTKPGFHPYHSDEGMSYSSATAMIQNLNLDPTRYDYPSLVPIIHLILFTTIFIPGFVLINKVFSPELLPAKVDGLTDLFQEVTRIHQQTDVLFWGRYITAAFSVGVVYMTYRLAVKITKDRRIGLVAAFFTATNFRQVMNSHIALPDTYNAFFLLIALYFIISILRKPSKKHYVIAGIASALAVSVKFQTFSIIALIAAHLFVSAKTEGGVVEKVMSVFNKKIILSGLIIGFIFLALNPYLLIHWEAFRDITSYNTLKYTVGVKQFSYYAIFYLYHTGIGKLISVSILVGILVSLRRYFWETLVLGAVVVPFFYIFAYYTKGGFYIRNFVSITPVLLMFAGVFVVWVFDQTFRSKKSKKAGAFFIILATLIMSINPIKNSYANSINNTRDWGHELARNWAAVNLPEGATIASHPWEKYPEDRNLKRVELQTYKLLSVSEMQDLGVDYAFVNNDFVAQHSLWWINKLKPTPFFYWEKPDDILANTYTGVAAKELASWSIETYIKPWQAPDMNFYIVKIPERISISEKKEIASYGFDSDAEGWKFVDSLGNIKGGVIFDPATGGIKPGSMRITKGNRTIPVTRAYSNVISVEGGKAYEVSAFVRQSADLDLNNREGVVRVDFFAEDPGNLELSTRSLESTVSSRFYEMSRWTQVNLTFVPSDEAKYMTVGLQTNGATDTWIDDIVVYESVNDFEDLRAKKPYNNYQISDDILFPFSQAGL